MSVTGISPALYKLREVKEPGFKNQLIRSLIVLNR
jgi:hypothetical protein